MGKASGKTKGMRADEDGELHHSIEKTRPSAIHISRHNIINCKAHASHECLNQTNEPDDILLRIPEGRSDTWKRKHDEEGIFSTQWSVGVNQFY